VLLRGTGDLLVADLHLGKADAFAVHGAPFASSLLAAVAGDALARLGASAERARLEARMPVKLQDGTGYLRGVLRALQAGEVVLTACDGTGGGQELGRRYERVVLGQRMRLPVGGFYLAKRGNARLHPLVTVRDPQDARRHLSVIGPQLLLGTGDLKQVLEDGADRTALLLEDMLRRYPGQWLFWDAFKPGELLC
jgi:lauroyl/myristoyl acyltransferase